MDSAILESTVFRPILFQAENEKNPHVSRIQPIDV